VWAVRIGRNPNTDTSILNRRTFGGICLGLCLREEEFRAELYQEEYPNALDKCSDQLAMLSVFVRGEVWHAVAVDGATHRARALLFLPLLRHGDVLVTVRAQDDRETSWTLKRSKGDGGGRVDVWLTNRDAKRWLASERLARVREQGQSDLSFVPRGV
jgi:hypothetical protein